MKDKKNLREPILYIVFGVLTTLVNIVTYYCFADGLQVHYLVANGIAWVLSVLFAFVTNKLFVFESKSWVIKLVISEMCGFFLARVATGVLDMALMWVLMEWIHVEKIQWNLTQHAIISGDMLAKVVVNVIVIVLNYVASKLWIFRKKN